MRLIDADAFLERNEELADCDFNHPMYGDTLREIVDAEPTAQQWIPVSERLPSEDGDWYFVTWRWIGTYSCEAYLHHGFVSHTEIHRKTQKELHRFTRNGRLFSRVYTARRRGGRGDPQNLCDFCAFCVRINIRVLWLRKEWFLAR